MHYFALTDREAKFLYEILGSMNPRHTATDGLFEKVKAIIKHLGYENEEHYGTEETDKWLEKLWDAVA